MLHRSSSQPNFESITEEDGSSSSRSNKDSEDDLRPILSSQTNCVCSHASQTDITALQNSPSKNEKSGEIMSSSDKNAVVNQTQFSRSISADVPVQNSKSKTVYVTKSKFVLERGYSIDGEKTNMDSQGQTEFSQPTQKSVSFQIIDKATESRYSFP